MAARLQQATTSGKPILLRVDFDAGHGIGTMRTQREEELADIYSFLLWQFGDPQFQPPPLPARAEPAAPAAVPAPAAAPAPAPAGVVPEPAAPGMAPEPAPPVVAPEPAAPRS
jgi:prolyl oligopeptidase